MNIRQFLRKHVRLIFFLYLLVLMKVIIFKYPLEQLQAIAASWRKEVILEGLDTANFTLFKTIRMYIIPISSTALKIWWEISLPLFPLAFFCLM